MALSGLAQNPHSAVSPGLRLPQRGHYVETEGSSSGTRSSLTTVKGCKERPLSGAMRSLTG